MNKSLRIALITFALLALSASSPLASAGPEFGVQTDKYAKVFAGKTLTDGRGFVGQLEIGAPLPVVVPLLDWGLEKAMQWGFWYFYEKGPWKLTVVARPDYERCNFLYHVEALILEGEQAPPTSRGIRIGDPISKVHAQYGQDHSTLSEKLDSRGVTKTTWRNPNMKPPDMTERNAFDLSVRLGHYYPQHGMLFTYEDGKVSRIIALFEYNPTALWLRETPDPPLPWSAIVKKGVKKPTWQLPDGKPHQQGLLYLPATPAVEPANALGLKLAVPKGWIRKESIWTSPLGGEQVIVEVLTAEEDDEAEDWFDELEFGPDHLLTDSAQRPVPVKLLALMGAEAGRTYHHQEPKGGIDDWPVRKWELLLAKGLKRYRVTVTRTVWGRNPSPDGMELARRVLRSIRIGS